MRLKEATLYDLLQRDAQGTYKRWCDNLKVLRDIGDPSARKIYEDDLREIHAKASELLSTGQLNSKVEPMMKIIVSRPVEQWIILHRNPHSQVVPSF
jgi:hypothetical protein